jgi:hypothetical protein
MLKKKTKNVLVGSGVVLILISIFLSVYYFGFVQQTSFTQYTGNVVLPLTAFYECKAQFPTTKSYTFQPSGFFVVTPDEKTGYCGRNDVQGYFPEGCEYTLQSGTFSGASSGGILEYEVCNVDEEKCGESTVFSKRTTTLSGGAIKKIVLLSSQRLYMKGYQSTSYSLRAVPYALESTSPTQGKFIAPSEDQCRLIQTDVLFQFDAAGRVINFDSFQLKPQDKPINVVVGGVSVVDPKNVIYHPLTGEIVYVKDSATGIQVCKTVVVDGKRWVNLQQCQQDAEIFCLPSNPACSDSGNDIVNNPGEGKSCGLLTGIIDGYVPVSATERCLIQCVDGVTKIDKSNCIEIKTTSAECPSDRPLLIGNKCVAPSQADNELANQCESGGGTWVQKETSECGFLCSIGFSKAIVTQESFCRGNQGGLYLTIVVASLIIAIALISTGGNKKKR